MATYAVIFSSSLAGDSLTGQMIDTLAVILRAEILDYRDPNIIKFVGCHGTLKFSWYRNDFLDTRTTGFQSVNCEDPDVSGSRCVVFAGKVLLVRYWQSRKCTKATRMGFQPSCKHTWNRLYVPHQVALVVLIS